MGLTREQWHVKRVNEIKDYVKEHGHKVKDIYYWDTWPICVKDICVLGVGVIGDTLAFGDMRGNDFHISKSSDVVERVWLESALADMKLEDKNRKK